MNNLIENIEKIIIEKKKSLKGFDDIETGQCYLENNCKVNLFENNASIKTKNLEYIVNYENLGVYDEFTKTWYWASGFNLQNKEKTKLSNKIKKMIIEIIRHDAFKLEQRDNELLSYFIKNSIYLEKENLEILIKLCLYLLKDQIEWIMPYTVSNKLHFLIIQKIISSK